MIVNMPNRMLVECELAENAPAADWPEKASNICLSFLRTALGSTYRLEQIEGTLTPVITRTHSAAFRALAGLMAFTLWLPLTLIGMVVWACSRSHAQAFIPIHDYFQTCITKQRVALVGHDPVALADLYTSEIAPRPKAVQIECLSVFSPEQLAALSRRLTQQYSPETTFENLLHTIGSQQASSLDEHVKRATAIFLGMGLSDPLEWVNKRKDKDTFYPILVSIALFQIQQILERPIGLNPVQDREMRIGELTKVFETWHNAIGQLSFSAEYLTTDAEKKINGLLEDIRRVYPSTPFIETVISNLPAAQRLENCVLIIESLTATTQLINTKHNHIRAQLNWLRGIQSALQACYHKTAPTKLLKLYRYGQLADSISEQSERIKTLQSCFWHTNGDLIAEGAYNFIFEALDNPKIPIFPIPFYEAVFGLATVVSKNRNCSMPWIDFIDWMDKPAETEPLENKHTAVDAVLVGSVLFKKGVNLVLENLQFDELVINERRAHIEATVAAALQGMPTVCQQIVLDYYITFPKATTTIGLNTLHCI